jgi:putative tricarboxylic transport membrane protein
MDHLVAAMVMQAAGEDPTAVNYIPYDAGGEAMAGLLSGEIDALSTGFSEAIALADQGEVRILGVTAPERVPPMTARPPSWSRASTRPSSTGAGSSRPRAREERWRRIHPRSEAMYDTDAWEEVRARNGWVNIWNSGDDFRTFLEAQERRSAT